MKQPFIYPAQSRLERAKNKEKFLAEAKLKELLEAGAHFGHQTRRWNPKMKPYIFGVRGGVHIIDLTQTVDKLETAAEFAKGVTENGGKVLFVGTKRQARSIIRDEATKVDMPYVTERWLGGMLTNFRTIKARINHLKRIETGLESGDYEVKYNKKEVLDFTNEAASLNGRCLSAISFATTSPSKRPVHWESR
jgi:small subunit ribosomal protein S2